MSEEKIAKNDVVNEPINKPAEPVPTAPPQPAPKVVTGVVDNCARLNVRDTPNLKGKVLKVIEKDEKVTINEAASINDWYKVTLKDGVKGFCMKKFIKLKP